MITAVTRKIFKNVLFGKHSRPNETLNYNSIKGEFTEKVHHLLKRYTKTTTQKIDSTGMKDKYTVLCLLHVSDYTQQDLANF